MSSPFDLVEGDIGTELDIPLVDQDGNAIDITGATIVWHWQHDKKEPTTKAGTIQDGAGGITRYVTQAGDIEVGDLRIQIEITLAGGWHGRSDPVFYKVGRKLIKGL